MYQKIKKCTQINNWIYHCNIYQPPHLSLKRRTPITLQSYFNCIETKQDLWKSFGESKIYLISLLLAVFLYNKSLYIIVRKAHIYAQTMMAPQFAQSYCHHLVCTLELFFIGTILNSDSGTTSFNLLSLKLRDVFNTFLLTLVSSPSVDVGILNHSLAELGQSNTY